MRHDSVFRTQFLQNIAAGSTGAALGSALAGAPAAGSAVGRGLEPPLPHTMESYPIVEPGKGVAADHLKIVSAEQEADVALHSQLSVKGEVHP